MIERKVKSVRALERGLDVLFEIRRRRAASLHELHQALGLPKATLLRMLVTLAGRDLVWQRLADGAYLPGTMHGAPNFHPDALDRLAEVASPHLARLSFSVAWPSVVAVPRLDHVEIIETNSPMTRLDAAMLGPVGAKLSYIHTATGRAYLAACDPVERAAIIARLKPADASPASIAALDAIIAEIQARGWSARDPLHPWPDRSRADVVRDGRRSVAVAIHVGGEAVAAINITCPARRMTLQDIVDRHLGTLRTAAREIGRTLEDAYGFRGVKDYSLAGAHQFPPVQAGSGTASDTSA
ncbi:MAG TPA: IclR family transcriptional regulator C-terminal domain-containing protein [Sphingomonadaceae bacterium]|nr:IclR family transcriptional regulator C-terminal domain-containing protein [Sphingomonadaceae bacterium]